jgi:hypothetical protein
MLKFEESWQASNSEVGSNVWGDADHSCIDHSGCPYIEYLVDDRELESVIGGKARKLISVSLIPVSENAVVRFIIQQRLDKTAWRSTAGAVLFAARISTYLGQWSYRNNPLELKQFTGC